jgi:hypothetical protein
MRADSCSDTFFQAQRTVRAMAFPEEEFLKFEHRTPPALAARLFEHLSTVDLVD